MRAYLDSDVLIWHLRGDRRALDFFQSMADRPELELWTGALQRAEVVFFVRPEEERATALFLSSFAVAPVDAVVVDAAARLYRKWHASHGIDINDAFLAATAMATGGLVYTLNTKHYPMPELRVFRAFPE
jgi:hypothetical protein